MRSTLSILAALALLPACQGSDGPEGVPGDADDTQPFALIAESAVIRFTGTEPFWGGEIKGSALRWTTPEDIDGTTIVVERFAGRGGLSYTGLLDGEAFTIAITPGDCSDGMSDRTYPFVSTVAIGDRVLAGCAWRNSDDLGPSP